MNATAIGQIQQIGDKQQITEKFSKRELIIKTVEQYPNFFAIEFQNGNAALLDHVEEGQNVKISVNIKGREYTSQEGNYSVFHSLVGWKIESA